MNNFGPLHYIVRQGHEECGDDIAIYEDDKKLILAVFDGVSGEEGAKNAAKTASQTILNSLKIHDVVNENLLKMAIIDANKEIEKGFTTISLAFIEKTGKITLASVGDSAIYSKSKGKIYLELPLGRAVGNGDSIMKFFAFRNIVTSVLGPSESDMEVHIADGILTKGDILIIASDGLVDNLFVETKNGLISDSSGVNDLESLIKSNEPKEIIKELVDTIDLRLKTGRIEESDKIIEPKKDDLSIIVFRWDYG